MLITLFPKCLGQDISMYFTNTLYTCLKIIYTIYRCQYLSRPRGHLCTTATIHRPVNDAHRSGDLIIRGNKLMPPERVRTKQLAGRDERII